MAGKMRMGMPSGLTSLLKDGYKHMSGAYKLYCDSAYISRSAVAALPRQPMLLLRFTFAECSTMHRQMAQLLLFVVDVLLIYVFGSVCTTAGLEEAILRNIEACRQLASITRTSLGPNAMKKLVVNHLEKLFVTSDAATIVQELEVQHPAARMLVQAAKMQEQEVRFSLAAEFGQQSADIHLSAARRR